MAKGSFKAGRPLLMAGTLTLPTSGWTATVAVFDTRNPVRPAMDYGMTVTLTAVAVNAVDPAKTDYAVVLSAPASVTATWPVKGMSDRLTFEGDVEFVPTSGQATGTKRRFSLEVRA